MNSLTTYLTENCKPAYLMNSEVYRMNGERVTSDDNQLYVIPNEIIAELGVIPAADEFTKFVESTSAASRSVVTKIDNIIGVLNRSGLEVELLYTPVFNKELLMYPMFAVKCPLVTLSPAGRLLKRLIEGRRHVDGRS